jgi:hypothetical protein
MQTIRRRAGFRTWIVPALALTLALGMSACYEDYNLGYKDYDTALTLYDNTVNFAQYRYYVMPDTIIHVYDTTKADPNTSGRKYDKQILSVVASNFGAHGYERLADTSEIAARGNDRNQVLVVLNGQLEIEWTGYYYNYWYPYWGWYWGGYYPYYPPTYGGTYEYSTGTHLIDVIDYGKTTAEQSIRPVWLGTVSGLTGDVSTSVQQRVATNINQLFLQSPYLYAGQ